MNLGELDTSKEFLHVLRLLIGKKNGGKFRVQLVIYRKPHQCLKSRQIPPVVLNPVILSQMAENFGRSTGSKLVYNHPSVCV